MPVVTVVIPTYNRRHLLFDTLDSVRTQTLTDIEVIVIDDGSTDGTEAAVAEVAARQEIRYVRQRNAGQAAARNRGLCEARGRYICFLDDDDLWPADKLEWQVAALDREADVDLVGGDYSTHLSFIRHTRQEGEARLLDYASLFYGSPFKSPGQITARTDAVRQVGGFVEAIRGAEDYDLYVRLAKVRPILQVPRLALQYREHRSGFSKNYWNMLSSCSMCLGQRLPEVPLRERWSMSRRAHRWLYEYVGCEVLLALRHGERPSGIGGAVGWKRLLGHMAPGLLSDPKLAARFIGDALSPRRKRLVREKARASLAIYGK